MKEVSLSVGLHHPNVVRYLGATLEEETFNIFHEWTAGKEFLILCICTLNVGLSLPLCTDASVHHWLRKVIIRMAK